MNIVTDKHLKEAAQNFKDAAKELTLWSTVAASARWKNIEEVRAVFKDADAVDGYVVFNVRRNRYRLITHIHYAKDEPKKTDGHIYIRSVLTHAKYDDKTNWDPFASKKNSRKPKK